MDTIRRNLVARDKGTKDWMEGTASSYNVKFDFLIKVMTPQVNE